MNSFRLLEISRLEHKTKIDIKKALKVNNIVEDIQLHQQNWKTDVQRMDRNSIVGLHQAYNDQVIESRPTNNKVEGLTSPNYLSTRNRSNELNRGSL